MTTLEISSVTAHEISNTMKKKKFLKIQSQRKTANHYKIFLSLPKRQKKGIKISYDFPTKEIIGLFFRLLRNSLCIRKHSFILTCRKSFCKLQKLYLCCRIFLLVCFRIYKLS